MVQVQESDEAVDHELWVIAQRVCVCVSAAYITATYSTPWQAIGNALARRRHLRLTAFGRWSRRTLLGAGLTARTRRKKLVPRPRV